MFDHDDYPRNPLEPDPSPLPMDPWVMVKAAIVLIITVALLTMAVLAEPSWFEGPKPYGDASAIGGEK